MGAGFPTNGGVYVYVQTMDPSAEVQQVPGQAISLPHKKGVGKGLESTP